MKLLIIDEISMVRADVLDAIELSLRINRKTPNTFGGVQILFVGDMYQLPPVLTKDDLPMFKTLKYKSPYFFSANVFEECRMEFIELTKGYRQSDEAIIELLRKLRVGEDLDTILPILNKRYVPVPASEQVLTLTCFNKDADRTNDRRLNELTGEQACFVGEISGQFGLKGDKLPSPMELYLKVGAQVMFTKNDEAKRWVNGTIGQVIEINKDFIKVDITNKQGSVVHEVKQALWIKTEYTYKLSEGVKEVVLGKYRQYPLMLAWAMSIHKAQSKTIDKVLVDLGRGAFAFGQVYVALSRCRSLEDIYLVRPIKISDISCDPIIKRFYEEVRRVENQKG